VRKKVERKAEKKKETKLGERLSKIFGIFSKKKEKVVEKPIARLVQTPKPKDCFVWFPYSRVLGRLVKPYYEHLADRKIKIYWVQFNGDEIKGVMETVLPEACFYKGGVWQIRSGNLIIISDYDIFGNPVPSHVHPLIARIRELERQNELLKRRMRTMIREFERIAEMTESKAVHSFLAKLRKARSSMTPTQGEFIIEETRREKGEEYG